MSDERIIEALSKFIDENPEKFLEAWEKAGRICPEEGTTIGEFFREDPVVKENLTTDPVDNDTDAGDPAD